MIALLGLRLARSTVGTLLDRAPKVRPRKPRPRSGLYPGVLGVDGCGCGWRLDDSRRYRAGAPHLSIDRVDDIKRKGAGRSQQCARRCRPDLHAVPVARDNERVRERIMVIARNSGLAIHMSRCTISAAS